MNVRSWASSHSFKRAPLMVLASASVAGFLTGWSIGADVASGVSFLEALNRTRLMRVTRRLRGL